MAFWGVEVKPGKPITHFCAKARGRLRISQATLGFGEALNKSVVQCNVGNRSPVLLCVLLPGQTESSHLDLEFEEADDVVFSVLGPRSVYLTGYYVRQIRQSNSRSDTESYGVDIENTQTDESNYNTDDERYGGSFINDDELQFSPGSPVICSDQGMDGGHDVKLEKDKRKAKKGRGKLKKKHRVIESDNDMNLPRKEGEDDFSVSPHESEKDVKTTTSDTIEKIAQVTVEMEDEEAKDDGVYGSETKQNVDPLDTSDNTERGTQPPLDEEETEINNGKNNLPKQVGFSEKIIVSNQEEIHGSNTSEALINQNLPMINGEDLMQSLDLEKPQKKRKYRPLTETSEDQTDNEDPSVPREHKELEIDSSAAALKDFLGVFSILREIGENHLVAPELDSENGQKSKKRRNELLEEELTQGTLEKTQNTTEGDLFTQGSLHADGVTEHLVGANEKYQQKSEETSMEKFGVECRNVQNEDEVMHEAHADSITKDILSANGENQKDQIDSNIITEAKFQANDNQLDNKIKKKKKKKIQIKKDLNTSETQMSVNQENEDQSTKIVQIDTTTLSNGLIIEELESGPPGGKVAVPGKTVKIYYTGMLEESGHVFDTNVGRAAFKFRLGDEELLDGWNVGINGMRVGDKRRLIIPPSMGFGKEGNEMIPPNSWIIYDMELVSVRR